MQTDTNLSGSSIKSNKSNKVQENSIKSILTIYAYTTLVFLWVLNRIMLSNRHDAKKVHKHITTPITTTLNSTSTFPS